MADVGVGAEPWRRARTGARIVAAALGASGLLMACGPPAAPPDPEPPSAPEPSLSDDDDADPPEPPSGPDPSALPGWMSPPAPVPDCPEATVRVGSADELQDALDDAGPGAVIQLEAGLYEGRFTITSSGADGDPARLCGSAAVVLDGGSTWTGYVLHLDGAEHWVVQDLTVRHGQKGVMVDGAHGIVLRGLTVHTIGDEAVHLRRGTTDSVVDRNRISDTGLREPLFGEGVYVGSAHSNWCLLTDCEPDRSDRNVVRGNVVHHVTAEAVDIKEGTRDGWVVGNVMDGAGTTAARAWVAVKGNGWVVADNVGRHAPEDGVRVYVVRDGWGEDNRVTGNVGRLDDEDGRLVVDDAPGTRADCSNRVLGDVGRSGLDC